MFRQATWPMGSLIFMLTNTVSQTDKIMSAKRERDGEKAPQRETDRQTETNRE